MISVGVTIFLVIVIIVSLLFALTNGLNDASSVVATFLSCGAATPVQAILVASFFGLLGAILGGSAVADTVSKVVVLPVEASLLPILLAAILGAVVWNLITWRIGLPSSSTHALIGGIIGAVWVSTGSDHIQWGFNELIGTQHKIVGITKVIVALILSPLLGFLAAFVLQKLTNCVLRNAKFSINKILKRLQWIMAALLAYSHGANDTQKVIGIITLALSAAGNATLDTAPLWLKICGGLVMFAGTMFGGWSIMKTIGRGIYTLRPIHSLNSQITSGGAVLFATFLGAPVSTTHVVVGSITGVGAADEYKMVHWSIAKEIITAWLITIPMAALVAAGVYKIVGLLFKIA
jgi:inorganic phosphate transporter, PiT family